MIIGGQFGSEGKGHVAYQLAPADGFFVAIGRDPNTQLFRDWHDQVGYVVMKPDSTETNLPGVSAAGDINDTPLARRSPRPARAAWPHSTRRFLAATG